MYKRGEWRERKERHAHNYNKKSCKSVINSNYMAFLKKCSKFFVTTFSFQSNTILLVFQFLQIKSLGYYAVVACHYG